MTQNLLVKQLDKLKRENTRLRRALSKFSDHTNWEPSNNRDLLTESWTFLPQSDKIQEKPWAFAHRALQYKPPSRKGQKGKSDCTKKQKSRFSKLL